MWRFSYEYDMESARKNTIRHGGIKLVEIARMIGMINIEVKWRKAKTT